MTACAPCQYDRCTNPFDRVVVSYLLRGGTRVMWEMRDDFVDPRPYTFTLQVGRTRNPDADDWTTVGVPVTDAFFAIDGEQRVHGKLRPQFYRVWLETSRANYVSEPTGIEGTLSRRDWRIAGELLRQELLRMRNTAGQEGYLLKRRIAGDACPRCTDHLTGEVRDGECPVCYGTGFRCGYFFPMDCVWADIDPRTYRVKVDGRRGTVMDVVVRARMANPWMLVQGDVWVNKVTDDRYVVHSVQHVAEIRGVPIAASVELRPLPASSILYSLSLPGQVADTPAETGGFF